MSNSFESDSFDQLRSDSVGQTTQVLSVCEKFMQYQQHWRRSEQTGHARFNGCWKTVSMFVVFCLAGLWSFSSLSAQDQTTSTSDHAAKTASADAGNHGEDLHGEYSLKSDLPLWSAIAFIGFILAIKGLGLWDLLLNSMSDREKAETEAISSAEADLMNAQSALRHSKGRLEALDEQIRETMAEAQRDAQSTRDHIFSAADNEANAAVDRATFEINRVRDQSLNDIFETLSDQVTTATESRLRSGLHAEDHGRLIETMLGDLAIH